MGLLFNYDFGQDDSPIDDPEITQVIFYFGKEDAILFKKLCKEAMKIEFENYIEDGNMSELLLKVLKRNYEHLLPQKSLPQPTLFGEIEGNLPKQE